MLTFLIVTTAASMSIVYGFVGLAVYRNWPTEKLREIRERQAEAKAEIQSGAR